MAHHRVADGSKLQSVPNVPDISKEMEVFSTSASQTGNNEDVIAQRFRCLVNQISEALENVAREIDIDSHNSLLVYKRLKRPGKHAIINYDVIVNANCRICNKSFPSPFQARTLCCELAVDIPWPVFYTGKCESGDTCFPSISDLVGYLKFMPSRENLIFYCPFLCCGFESKGYPDCRHVSEQHLLFHAKKTKQPALCTIGNCGLYLKRPDEKLREHQSSTHRDVVANQLDKPTTLSAPTHILLAALVPDKFYETGLKYYREEYEYKATHDELEDGAMPERRKSSSSRKKYKSEIEDIPAAKAPSSRKTFKLETEVVEAPSLHKPSRLETEVATPASHAPFPHKTFKSETEVARPAFEVPSSQRTFQELSNESLTAVRINLNWHKMSGKDGRSNGGIVGARVGGDQAYVNSKIGDESDDYETSSGEGHTASEYLTEIHGHVSSSFTGESGQEEVDTYSRLKISPAGSAEDKNFSCTSERKSFKVMKFFPSTGRFGKFKSGQAAARLNKTSVEMGQTKLGYL